MRRPYDLMSLLRQEQRQETIRKLERELKEREHELEEDEIERETGQTRRHLTTVVNP